MKTTKIFALLSIFLMIALASCGKDDEPVPTFTDAENQFNQYLAGTWEGVEYVYGIPNQTEVITFTPLSQPEVITLQKTEYVTLTREYKLIGKAEIHTLFGSDKHEYDTDGKEYFYAYDATEGVITFLYAVNGVVLYTKIDSRNFKKLNASEFKMKSTGLADLDSNWITFIKQ